MMVEGSLVTILALAWLFLGSARRASCASACSRRASIRVPVRRAVRYGRAQEFEQAR